jgi:hypothetical protein
MTVTGPYTEENKYFCLSTDTKPGVKDRIAVGSSIFETDTGIEFFWSGDPDAPGDGWAESFDALDTATETKQDVVISNQTSGGQKTQIVGTTGSVAEVNSDNQLHIVAEGHLCSGNSTAVPLLAGQSFTGDAENILQYNGVAIFVTADAGSAEMGLSVQYSSDGLTNWREAEAYTVLADSEKWFTPPAFGVYFRVVYTNGAVDQTSFELVTVFRKMPFKWSSHNIDVPIKDQDDAELVKAVITGKKVNGDYDNVSLTNGANMKVSLEELESGISSNSNSQLNTTLFESAGGEFKQDLTTGAFTTISYDHHEIHSGSHFFTGNYTDLANGQVYDILIVTPNTLKYSHMIFELRTEAEAMFGYYEATTTSANGTAMTVFDRNRVTANTAGTTFFHTPTVTSVGTLLGSGIFGSGNKQGGGLRDSNEFILKPNSKYLVRVTNNTALANWYDWQFDWYEHTNR